MGDFLKFRLSLPDFEIEDSSPEAWRGADALGFHFKHQKNGLYHASILTMTGNKPIAVIPDPDDDGAYEEAFTANLRVLEKGDDFRIVLVDLNTSIDSTNFTAFVVLSTGSESFMSFLPCRHTSEIQLQPDWHKVRCEEGVDRSGLSPHGTVSFRDLKRGETKLNLFRNFVRRRLLVFAVDCDAFPRFREGLFGFETRCFSWESG